MKKSLGNLDGVISDYDGVGYNDKDIPNLDALCDHAHATAAIQLAPDLSYQEAHAIGVRSYRVYGDCVGGFVEWAEKQGLDAQAYRHALFKSYHQKLRELLLKEHSAIFAPHAPTIDAFKSCAPHTAMGIATHSCIETWAGPLLEKQGLLHFFDKEARIGLDDVNFARKSESSIAIQTCLNNLEIEAYKAGFIEDNLKNLERAKAELPDLTTIFMHHGTPLDHLPNYVDCQYRNWQEVMSAIAQGKHTRTISLP